MTLDVAETFADVGRYDAALAAIGQLSDDEQNGTRGLQVRVRCCAALARWEEGNEIAAVLAGCDDLVARMMAAGFWHCLTVAHLQDGDKIEARAAASRALQAWPGCRIKMQEDNRLAGLF